MKLGVHSINIQIKGDENGPVIAHPRCRCQMKLAAEFAAEVKGFSLSGREADLLYLTNFISVFKDPSDIYWVVAGLINFALIDPQKKKVHVIALKEMSEDDLERLAWIDLISDTLLKPKGGGYSPYLLFELAYQCPKEILFETTGLKSLSRRGLADYLGIDARNFPGTLQEGDQKSRDVSLTFANLGLPSESEVDG